MKRTPHISNIDMRLLGILLMPSWLSSIISICVGVGIAVGATLLTHYKSSDVRLEFLSYQASRAGGGAQATQAVESNGILANPIIGNLPLLLFWTLVGLVVYIFAANIFTAIQNTAELRSEMDYINADRQSLTRTAIEHLMVRLSVLICWVGYMLFFFHQILPYCVAAALAGAGSMSIFSGALYLLLSIAIMTVAMHIHVILFRLFLLRPRIFSRALYIS